MVSIRFLLPGPPSTYSEGSEFPVSRHFLFVNGPRAPRWDNRRRVRSRQVCVTRRAARRLMPWLFPTGEFFSLRPMRRARQPTRSKEQKTRHHSTTRRHPRAPVASFSLDIRSLSNGFKRYRSGLVFGRSPISTKNATIKTKRLAPRGIRTRHLQVRPRRPGVLALHEELRRRPRPAPAAKGEAAPRRHRPKLWHARVLPAVLGPNTSWR